MERRIAIVYDYMTQMGGGERVIRTTWVNERAVEIPVVRKFLEGRAGRILEVGNVMGHYGPADWDVVDRFERGARVLNCDVIEFRPALPYGNCVMFGYHRKPGEAHPVLR
ncbi:MAG: hypothetical protein BWK77_04695 [Verrucomicrobia bacterium A1]|nr:MAG: hypothetical protein BWK77_04695 [Verrucomicrobia bacterium A1]